MPALGQAALAAAAVWIAGTDSRLDKSGSLYSVCGSRLIVSTSKSWPQILPGTAYEIAASGSSTKCGGHGFRTFAGGKPGTDAAMRMEW